MQVYSNIQKSDLLLAGRVWEGVKPDMVYTMFGDMVYKKEK